MIATVIGVATAVYSLVAAGVFITIAVYSLIDSWKEARR